MKFLRLLSQTFKYLIKNPKDMLSPSSFYKNIKKFINRLFSKTENPNFYNPFIKSEYHYWINKNEDNFIGDDFSYRPLISIIIPVYNVKAEYLEKCIDSVLGQSYDNFEICIVDDNSSNEDTINTLKRYESHEKIKIFYNTINENISGASNRAVSMSNGEFIALLDNDDMLDEYALSNIVKVLNENKNLDFIYTDEDKIDEKDVRFDPFFKPNFSPDTLLSYNYICHFSVIRKSLFDKVGGFRSKYDGCQDYDLFLRLVEMTNKIHHISKILYHWRSIDTSTAKSIDNKSNIVSKTKVMLEETIKRRGLKAEIEVLPENNFYVKYSINSHKKISIIIPTKDHSLLLSRCIDSILTKTAYPNYEIIIVNNNSSEKETFDLFKKYSKNPKIRVIDANVEFNYSYLNNLAVSKSSSDFVVLLNNDTEVISANWLTEMVRYASLKHVGVVGVKLLYPDNTIQHGGVILGFGGVAGHAFINQKRNYSGPFSTLKVVRNVGGNTAACIMIDRKKYLEVDGLDEKIKVAFNDVDFNLKMLDKGYYNVFLPNVELYHYESKSRGLEDTPSKIKRFNSEVDYMKEKWKDKLSDPYYNDNYSYFYDYKLDIK